MKDKPVRLNVGGKEFLTSLDTILSEPDTFFCALIHFQNGNVVNNGKLSEYAAEREKEPCYFIDRDPTYFPIILNHLRGYDVYTSIQRLGEAKELLLQDVLFYGLNSMKKYFPLLSSKDRFAVAIDNSIFILDSNTGRYLHCIERAHEGSITHMEHVPDNFLITCSKNEIKIWNTMSGSCLDIFSDHVDSIIILKRLNKTYFLTGTGDHAAMVWNLETRQCIYTLKGVNNVLRMTDDLFLTIPLDSNSIHVRDTSTGDIKRIISNSQPFKSVIKITKQLFACGGSYTLNIWNIETGECVNHFIENKECFTNIVKISNNIIASMFENTIHIWNLNSSNNECISRVYTCPGLEKVLRLSDELFIAAGTYSLQKKDDKSFESLSLYIWNSINGKCILPHLNKVGCSFKDMIRLSNHNFAIACQRRVTTNNLKYVNLAQIGIWNSNSQIMHTIELSMPDKVDSIILTSI
jgi:WD40 repeat protein